MRCCSTPLLHRLVKLGPEGALTGALAALDIALWDIKGKLFEQPIYKLLGGAWRTGLPVLCLDRRQWRAQRRRGAARRRSAAEGPAGGGKNPLRRRPHQGRCRHSRRYRQGAGGAQAGRRCFPLAFDANNGYSVGGAIRVGRALEELGYWWFEEPVQHYHVKAMGEVAQRLDITVSAGEQTYTLAGLGRSDRGRGAHGAAGHRQDGRHHRPDALRRAGQCARRRAGAAPDAADDRPYGQSAHRRRARCTPPSPASWNDPSPRTHAVFENPAAARSTVSSTCRRSRDWGCGSTRRNWRSGACRSPELVCSDRGSS